jgi:hypothetical protein
LHDPASWLERELLAAEPVLGVDERKRGAEHRDRFFRGFGTSQLLG